ncbi:leucine-rich repeat-containing protein 34 [Brachyistius frenatus]|uniref:leucine-rich repeat-containing protein 34 n=1 Tax=Brachyistius frenatus TaxID=100188 RepID=UPI0037E7D328
MASATILKFYKAVCAKDGIEINPLIVEVLEKTAETGNFTLRLKGNNRLKCIQRLVNNDVCALSQCLENNERVTGLDLRYNNIGDAGAERLAHLLQEENSALRSLDLTFNDIESSGAEALANSLQFNSSLLSLRLSGNKIGNSGGVRLANMLQLNNTLQELQLADCDLSIESVTALGIMLKHNKALRSVDVSRPLLFSQRAEWTVHFSEMLVANSSLVELHLGKMGITDSAMERLADGLRVNRSLCYLDLRCNRVSRDGAQYLAEVLKENTALKVVDLSSNRIQDEGAVYLSEAIVWPGCVLRELSVRSNSIKTEGLLSLAEAMRSNTTLTHLYVWGNQLEESVCQAFSDLTSSGRLPMDQTDVSSYQVDGHVFLAEVFHDLRKRFYGTKICFDTDLNVTTETSSHAATSADATFQLHTEEPLP